MQTKRVLLRWTLFADMLFLLGVGYDLFVLGGRLPQLWFVLYLLLLCIHVYLIVKRGNRKAVWVVESDTHDTSNPRTVIPRGGP